MIVSKLSSVALKLKRPIIISNRDGIVASAVKKKAILIMITNPIRNLSIILYFPIHKREIAKKPIITECIFNEKLFKSILNTPNNVSNPSTAPLIFPAS